MLAGKTVGLVGLGGIGTAVAAGLAFGVGVPRAARNPTPQPRRRGRGRDAISTTSSRRDHVVLAAPAHRGYGPSPSTRTRSPLMKPGVHLVNIARGSLVDQDALRAALDDGRVALATLDTVEPEPLPDGHWMFTHPGSGFGARLVGRRRAPSSASSSVRRNVQRYVAGSRSAGWSTSTRGT